MCGYAVPVNGKERSYELVGVMTSGVKWARRLCLLRPCLRWLSTNYGYVFTMDAHYGYHLLWQTNHSYMLTFFGYRSYTYYGASTRRSAVVG